MFLCLFIHFIVFYFYHIFISLNAICYDSIFNIIVFHSCTNICMYVCIYIYIYIYQIHTYIFEYYYFLLLLLLLLFNIIITNAITTATIINIKNMITPSPPIKSFDFRGFDSSKLLILRGGNSHVHRI